MASIVQKFGGTSVRDIERIKNAALRVKRESDAGHEVAVVVSAMAGVTNQLVDWVGETSRMHDAREYDVVVSSGEQVTAGLLALALQDIGVNARSWLGWQIPLRTDGVHGKARIVDIPTAELERRFTEGQVAVVAGFRALAPTTASPRSGAAAPIPQPSRSPRRCAPIAATSSPMSTVSIRAIRGSSRRHASSTRSLMKKCWKWPRRVRRCCRRDQSRWR